MRVVVVGMGSLGSLVGALLARRHDVTLVGRERQVTAVRDGGLTVEGRGSFVARPAATTDWRGRADLAVVAVKSFDTGGAAAALAPGEAGAVLSLQNGMGNEAVLSERLDAPVVAGVTTLGATLAAPGRVEWRGRGRVTVGPWTDDAVRAARLAGAAFRTAGVPTSVTDGIRERLWEKLSVNAAINPLTALAGVRNGAVAEPPLADVAGAAAREVAAVARDAGVDLADERAVAETVAVARATADNRSSMARDVAAGRRTEVDAINGYVVDAADGNAPVNATLAGLVRARTAPGAETDPGPEKGAPAADSGDGESAPDSEGADGGPPAGRPGG